VRGLIYRSAFGYELAMAILYGRHYSSRYRAIAELIRPDSTVLDLCCGPAVLYHRYLSRKPVDYTGIDLNPGFIKTLIDCGAHGQVKDLRRDEPLPGADYVIMQASLYHFLPDPVPMLVRMLAAANEAVIIAEPIRNLANSEVPLVRSLIGLLTDPGIGVQPLRFTEHLLDETLMASDPRSTESFLICGGREKLYLIPGKKSADRRFALQRSE
jgi:hypothetical protein